MPPKHIASSSSLLTLHVGRRSIGCCFALVMALLLLGACSAGADTINLEVSPANPPRGGSLSVKASGSTSTRDEVHITSPPLGTTTCPQKYPGLEEERINQWKSPTPSWEWATTPSYNISFYFERAGSVVCGYLTDTVETKEYSFTYETITLASAELQVIYGPSEAEVAEQKQKYDEEAPARQAAQEAAEAQAKKAAEVKARELAEQSPVSFLRVDTVRHSEGSSGKPGRTKIEIFTNAYAHIAITLNHYEGTSRFQATNTGSAAIDVLWSCNHPDLTYHYTVTAIGGSGSRLSHSGSFKTVSDTWCANTKKREAAEAAQEARESADRSPAQRAVEEELKRTDDIISYRKEVTCSELNNKRYKCHWSGWNMRAVETGALAKCSNPSGTALVVFYKDGPEVSIEFLKKYDSCNYPY
jgi:hypothetical protein